MITGVHVGLGQGYEAALEYAKELKCKTVQIFTHSPRMFKFKPLEPDKQQILLDGWKAQGIDPVVSHASYLINIGNQDNKKFYSALGILKNELVYAAAFGCKYVVLHTGKYLDAPVEQGIAQVVKGINKLKPTFEETKVMLLLETASGQGTEIGRTFAEVQKVISLLDKDVAKHVGVCLDTCHIFAAGYDIRTEKTARNVVKEIKDTFGFDKLKVLHVNDSKFELGEKKDRHEHIGKGHIGFKGLKVFLNQPEIKKIPMIIETPINDDGDHKTNLAKLNSCF